MGKKMPDWVEQGWREYQRRMPSHVQLSLTEINPAQRSDRDPVDLVRREEAERILKRVDDRSHLILLDERGKSLDTCQWSEAFEQMMMESQRPVFVIGGADGVDDKIKQRADRTWTLSRLTFPHPLVRVLLAEQIYRALMLLQNHPYHRA